MYRKRALERCGLRGVPLAASRLATSIYGMFTQRFKSWESISERTDLGEESGGGA